MKKLLSMILAIVSIISAVSMTAFAANGINNAEESVLSMLRQTITIPNTKETYRIPEAYVVQAENFLLTYDLSDAQATEVKGYIQSAADRLLKEGEAMVINTGTFNLSNLPYEAKRFILDCGQKAAAVADLKLVYENGYVTITNTDGNVLFSSTPLIKQTGGLSSTVFFIITGVVAAMGIGTGAIVFMNIRRKKMQTEPVKA